MTDRTLRWYGWGYEDTSYSLADRPTAWSYLQSTLGLAEERHFPVVNPETIRLRPTRLSATLLEQLRQIVGVEAVQTEDSTRLRHSLGKSIRDLIQLRTGQITHPTDAVIFPGCEEEIIRLLALAEANGLAVIPFGGGTSVVGGVEPIGERPTLTLSLARLNRVLAVDALSQTVTAEAGILGPELERVLNAQGLTLGHFPQSFEFSTLGGWLATRGAGHASTKYGKIEEMVVSVCAVTPRGVVETRPTPANASGPSLLQLLVGSEGVYGVITQATMRLAPLPQAVRDGAFLFDDFQAGSAAVRAILQRGLTPALVRLSDESETQSSFALRKAAHGWKRIKEKLGLALLAQADKSFAHGALLLLRFDGSAEAVRMEYAKARSVAKAHGGFDLGAGPVHSWERERYLTPYLRDHLLDHAILVDTIETATTWDNVAALHKRIRVCITQAVAATGAQALVMTHLSHVYRDGASLYFTFLAPIDRQRAIEQWQPVKDAVTACIMAHGGALSHHHGIGYEHARWLEQENSQAGLAALRAIKQTLDPQLIMNPAKLFAVATPEG